ncbi:MAG: LLM class flavin-dependent oxidoreductase [Dehalococcoidia bacterium]|nr:LLM class flavin-dependent oxidoreductase [Dehalococcoidia bacterium]
MPSRGSRDRDAVFDDVRAADEAGVDTIWVGESWGEDAFTLMTQVVERTKHINVGSAIVNVYSRTPGTIAQHFGTLDVVSGGRMVIGLGTSGANVIEHFHGVPFKFPLRRLQEYVDIIKLLIAGEPLEYEGELFEMSRGFTLRFERQRDHIPIYLATLAPASLRTTSERADGWLPIWTPMEVLPQLSEEIRLQATKAGRPADAVTVRSPGGVVVTNDVERVRAQIAGTFAFYVARMGEFYYRHIHRIGYGEVADSIREAWESGGSAAGAVAVPADLQQSLTYVTDSIDAARERLAAEAEAGVGLHTVQVDAETPKEAERIYAALRD